MRSKTKAQNVRWIAAAVLGWALCSGPARGQVLNHFSLAPERYGPPHEAQMKTLLEGARAEQLAPGRYLVDQAKLRTFSEDGVTNMVIEAPQCLYEKSLGTVDSSGPIRMETAGGKFTIAGVGFLWQQTNSSLTISNQVHSVVHPDLLDPGTANTRTNESQAQAKDIDIFSDHFQYDTNSGLGIYSGAVRVAGTNLAMTGDTLTFKLPMSGALPGEMASHATLQTITADGHVAGDYSGIHVTSEHAVYSAETGLARLTGHPAWRTNHWAGSGDELLIDRTNKILRAFGQAFLEMPGQGVGASGLLLATNETAGQSPAASNQVVRIHSDNYELHTNWAVFHKSVQMAQMTGDEVQGTMTCDRMNATFTGTNQLQRLVAEDQVQINHFQTNHQEEQFNSGKAVYTGSNGVMELTDHADWQAGLRSGKGDLILVNTNEMIVRGNAKMRLPANEIGPPTLATSNPAKAAPPEAKPQEFADIYSEEYDLQAESARFLGGVVVSHPRMNMVAETMTAKLPPKGETAKGMVAEEGVEFIMADAQGRKMHGSGQKAVYAFDTVTGRTNETVTLFGNLAMLETTNSTFQNDVIVMDLANNKITARGAYVIRHLASTNILVMSRRHSAKK